MSKTRIEILTEEFVKSLSKGDVKSAEEISQQMLLLGVKQRLTDIATMIKEKKITVQDAQKEIDGLMKYLARLPEIVVDTPRGDTVK